MPKRPFEVHLEIRPQGYDIDVAGVVNNIVYLRWVEDLRMKILQEYWPIEHQLANGYVPAIAKTEVSYHRPVTIDETVHARMWVTKITKVRTVVEAEFMVGNEKVLSAKQSVCFVDLETKRPVPVPQELVDLFQNWHYTDAA